jgi:mRNA interferase RelE/StbE
LAEPFVIRYSTEAANDMRAMRVFDRRKVLDGILDYLSHEPTRVSKSRIKLMVQPFWSQYRLRLDEFRVYYDIDNASRRVNILRVLMKTTDPTPRELP